MYLKKNCNSIPFLTFVIVGLCISVVSTASWYDSAMLGMEVGPTGAQWGYSNPSDERYCAKLDNALLVRLCAEAGCDYIVLWARDGDYAYYNSKILPKPPGLKERDPLKDGVEEARKYELPVIAYCVVQQAGHYLEQHPEFTMKDLQGNPIPYRFCYNSGYLDAIKEIIDEILAYDVDGFHIDMIDQGFDTPYGCACDVCKKLFKEKFGAEIPTHPTWDDTWKKFLEFRYETSANFEKSLYNYIKQKKPNVSVDFNYHGNPPFSFEVGQKPVQHGINGDFITGETGIWGFSALTVGLNAQFYRAVVQNRQRVQVAIQRGVRMYHDQTTRPLNDIRWELLTLLAHGAFVTMVDKLGFDGTPDPIAYHRIRKAFNEVREKKQYFYHKPYYEVGIYFSSKTRDWIGRENPSFYFSSFLGAHKAMVYQHIPWCILLDENISLEQFSQLPVIIFPNVAILSDTEVGIIEEYVKNGGCAIFTGLSGCYDDLGNLSNYRLASITGCKFVKKLNSLDNWISLDPQNTNLEKALSNNIEHTQVQKNYTNTKEAPFLVFGPAGIFEATTAQPVGKLWTPHRTIRQIEGKEGTDLPMSPENAVAPAIFINTLGKGTIYTFACSPDYALASEYPLPECRLLLSNAIRTLHHSPPIQISAPVFIETVLLHHQEKNSYIIHAISYSSPPQTIPQKNRPYVLPSLIEDTLSYTLQISTAIPTQSIKCYNNSTIIEKLSEKQYILHISELHEIAEVFLKSPK